MARAEDITGQIFGRLTVIGRVGSNKWGKAKWECRCIEGNIVQVLAVHLRSGNTKSCGCLSREQATQRAYRHGDTPRNNVSPLYSCWIMMRQRCLNPKNNNYNDYGGRGITIAQEFNDYVAFRDYILQTLGPRPKGCSIDRINNDGNYEPGNLKWSTPSQQRRNQRDPKIDELVKRILNAPPIECYDTQS